MEEKLLNAFAYAAQTQDMKMLGFLMGEFGTLRKKDKNRLLAAVAQKAPHGKLLQPLIDAGADASYTDGDGNGLLHLVAATGHRKVASFLVGLG
nr:ankyrin repeat domain-containing protein [Treponema sp.]